MDGRGLSDPFARYFGDPKPGPEPRYLIQTSDMLKLPTNQPTWTSTEDLYLDKAGKVVKRGDPDCETKLVAAGGSIPLDQARELGLTDESRSAEAPDEEEEELTLEEEAAYAGFDLVPKGDHAAAIAARDKNAGDLATAKQDLQTITAERDKLKGDLATANATLKKAQDDLAKATKPAAPASPATGS